MTAIFSKRENNKRILVRALMGTVWKGSSVLHPSESVCVIIDTEWEFQKVWFGGLALKNQLLIYHFALMCVRSLVFFFQKTMILYLTAISSPSWMVCVSLLSIVIESHRGGK